MAFETLVRPFTQPFPLGTQRIPIIILQEPDQDAILTWGSSGTIIQPQEISASSNTSGGASSTGDSSGGGGGGGGGISFQIQSCNTKSEETNRETTTQRVHNPDDNTQFVDIQVPSAITFELKPQKSLLQSNFNTTTTTFANNDEIYSEVADVVDPPDQQDKCQQSFAFAPGTPGA